MQFLYGYSSNSPKNHLEFTKLTLIMKTKDNNILWNVKHVGFLCFYYEENSLKMLALLMKMVSNASTIALVTLNLNPLGDVDFFLSLVCFIPMLELWIPWWSLSNFLMFLFDFVAILNICQIDFKVYVDLTLAFND